VPCSRTPEGATDYIYADLREPGTILQEAARSFDFTQPIALMLLGVMEHIVDTDEARTIVSRLLDALPSGSYLALCDPTTEVRPEVMDEAVRQWTRAPRPRSRPAAARSCFVSSMVWNCWSPAWSRLHCGDPRQAQSARRLRYSTLAVWDESHDKAWSILLDSSPCLAMLLLVDARCEVVG
jgi:S-adenosyl methyltransferase